jgi:uncharacterized protein YoxC
METLIVTLALDVLVALLLGLTIIFCVKLNRRIRVLQDSKSELAELIRQFDESTNNATESIQEIHRASKRINENIQSKLDKANYLANDLEFMIDRANKVADKMDGQISNTRTSAKPDINAIGSARRTHEAGAAAEPADMKGGGKSSKVTGRAGSQARQPASEEKAKENVMERLAALKNSNAQEESRRPAGRRAGSRLRSKSEQELLEALKTKQQV